MTSLCNILCTCKQQHLSNRFYIFPVFPHLFLILFIYHGLYATGTRLLHLLVVAPSNHSTHMWCTYIMLREASCGIKSLLPILKTAYSERIGRTFFTTKVSTRKTIHTVSNLRVFQPTILLIPCRTKTSFATAFVRDGVVLQQRSSWSVVGRLAQISRPRDTRGRQKQTSRVLGFRFISVLHAQIDQCLFNRDVQIM